MSSPTDQNGNENTATECNSIESSQKMLVNIFNNTMMAYMISVGHRTGLFEIMSDFGGPATLDQIVEKSKFQRRYVQEWVSALVAGNFIVFNKDSETYFIPPHMAPCLTGKSGKNLAMAMHMATELIRVEDRLIECFEHGGGIGYDAYPQLQSIMDQMAVQKYSEASLASVLEKLSGELIQKLQEGMYVADVGCGCGVSTNTLAKLFPKSKFIGIDFLEESIQKAKNRSSEMNLVNIEFVAGDDLNFLNNSISTFDLIIAFDCVHDQAHPRELLVAIAKALRPDGYFLMAEMNVSSDLSRNIHNPIASGMYAISLSHCMSVSLSQGGEGLGACWGTESATKMLNEVGFKLVTEVVSVPTDIANAYFLCQAN